MTGLQNDMDIAEFLAWWREFHDRNDVVSRNLVNKMESRITELEAEVDRVKAVLDSPDTVESMQNAFHEADENGHDLDKCWRAAIAAIVERVK